MPAQSVQIGIMLTRSQVARRLGKSIATVRRLEGVLLFPSRGARGVHLFDDRDVERLRLRITSGLALPWGRDLASTEPHRIPSSLDALSGRVAVLEETVSELIEMLTD